MDPNYNIKLNLSEGDEKSALMDANPEDKSDSPDDSISSEVDIYQNLNNKPQIELTSLKDLNNS